MGTGKKIIYVIGAGAGYELDMPLGSTLMTQISDLVDFSTSPTNEIVGGDPAISLATQRYIVKVKQASREHTYNLGDFLSAARAIKRSMSISRSIDSYLHQRQDSPLIVHFGKLAIVTAILRAESRSRFFVSDGQTESDIEFHVRREHWLNEFYSTVSQGLSLDQLRVKLREIAFVIFNYDRCVEHFLVGAIATSYQVGVEKAAEVLSELEIVHPYGQVGYLPWQRGEPVVRFGDDPGSAQLDELSELITTYTEQSAIESPVRARVAQLFRLSETLVFLGFYFHKMNMDLLCSESFDIEELVRNRKFEVPRHCYCTAYKIPDPRLNEIKELIYRGSGISMGSISIHLSFTCVGLFQHYGDLLVT